MLMLTVPGVYRPQTDTRLLCEALRTASVAPGAALLDVCTGSGAVAIAGALLGARSATAVDLSRRAALTARANARLRRVNVRVLRGDLFGPVAGERFDVITANPPYVPCDRPPGAHSRARAWDAGRDGRDGIDRICAGAAELLAPGGTLLMVHSAVCGVAETLGTLRERNLKAAVVARRTIPFGPVMRSRAADLKAWGLLAPGQEHEEVVVIRADRAEKRG
ncbi:HemK2/MTQ2 family protein methyltransferase [Actinomadura parmotrematis]|uniref:Methyltransferase n=1 Tax=Actinomadura parmotrematis TaxID=2864039 RepID=A0ABS7FTU2_9ACTN|nr:HemK2/MTQ2 family protein methyltransferase [Actinomadura parmotrematis]MBW8483610.1 methyltransferase [Actinomadura parmotrematis]